MRWENAQRMLKAAMDDMELDHFEAEGEAASLRTKNWISRLKLPSVKKKPLLSSLTSASRTLRPQICWSRWRGTPSSHDSPWGYLNHGTLHSYLDWRTTRVLFPTWLAPHQVPSSQYLTKNTWTTLGKWLRKLRDRGVRADVDERNEKCSSKSALLKPARSSTN